MIVCHTNDQSTQEGGGRGNGKAMHAGPIRHSHKINQLARSLARSFILINETPRTVYVYLLDAAWWHVLHEAV